MKNLDLSQQIEWVRRIGESSSTVVGAIVCGIACVVSIVFFNYASHQTTEVLLLFSAGCFAMFTIALSVSYPQFRRAARAIREGHRVSGVLQLEVDQVNSEDITIAGVVTMVSGNRHLTFSPPSGWMPQSGEWTCELIYLPDDKMPVLVQLKEGLLFPTKMSDA